MRIDPYLMFNGQCEAAFKFYQQCLGGTIKAMLKFSDAPKGEGGEDAAGGCGPLPPGGKPYHVCLPVVQRPDPHGVGYAPQLFKASRVARFR